MPTVMTVLFAISMELPSEANVGIAFSPKGNLLASASADRTIKLPSVISSWTALVCSRRTYNEGYHLPVFGAPAAQSILGKLHHPSFRPAWRG
jgi:WD40 repeat protein